MNKLYHKEVIVKNVTQSTFNYTFHDLKPYTMYSITIYASNSKHEGDKAVSNYTTAEISELEQTFINLMEFTFYIVKYLIFMIFYIKIYKFTFL